MSLSEKLSEMRGEGPGPGDVLGSGSCDGGDKYDLQNAAQAAIQVLNGKTIGTEPVVIAAKEVLLKYFKKFTEG